MSTEDKRREFDDIVARLTTDYPTLSRAPWPRWPRPVLITVLVAAGVVWGFLSVAMVAWGVRGVLLTCAVVTVAAVAAVLDARKS
ncbi:hypothetical protein Aab01nite_08320 [Paractinoplanes abujensis]|uniref:DUF3040 family protein n=1 Tax=Paractinoplanes abujensis TaxID=882441 RepID=A0A7W7G091_9ACTN|nr:hypothetical protein [Actinoplanes abujensis]MBB4691344.1 hypothetical protein [Actinoplanes abujensis]GID17242.1 hypothetical protein Aab01nite_08320 [Actinoplanes abujensis]